MKPFAVQFSPSRYFFIYVLLCCFLELSQCRFKQNKTISKKDVCLIQGDSGGKVSILGGDSVGHCERKRSFEHVSNCEWLLRHSC
jgi:hypothetical protein